MKKLLLLLALSFFSIQSFAAGCPDGSEPVKSISADGTYFEYKCGILTSFRLLQETVPSITNIWFQDINKKKYPGTWCDSEGCGISPKDGDLSDIKKDKI